MFTRRNITLATLIIALLLILIFIVWSNDKSKTGHNTREGTTEKKATEGVAK